jgi:PAS domain S-box-containing protein
VFDLESRIIWWANQAGLDFWKAASLEDLQSRDFKGDSNTVVDRLNTVFHSTPKGQVSRESWTYYPLDEPVSTIADHMFVDIEDNRSAVLIQIEHVHPSDRDAQGLRLIEAARYTSVMVSMFSKSGDLLVENPAAIAFRTRHRSGDALTLRAHLGCSEKKARQVIRMILRDEPFSEERKLELDGETQTHLLTAKLGRDPMTAESAIFLTQEDISDRIKQSEDRYRAIFDTADDAIWISDPTKAGFIEMNPKAEALFGITQAEFNDGTYKFFDLSPEFQSSGERSSELAQKYTDRVLAGEAVHFDWTFVGLDGNEIPCEITMTQFPDPDRDLLRISMRNVSEKRQAEARYRAIFDSADDVIWIADTDPKDRGFIDFNRKAVELFGVTLEQFNDGTYNFFDFSPKVQPNGQDSLTLIRRHTKDALNGSSPTFEWTFNNKDKVEIPCEITLTRFPDPARDLLRASVRDISEKKKAERIQLDLENQLVQAQKLESLGQLTGGVAHDFNNLLAVVMGNMELLLDETFDAEQVKLIESAIKATQRGARITRSLQAFARKSDLNPTTLDLHSIVEDMNNWISSVIPDNVSFEASCGENLQAIEADLAGIERTLLNLVINARDAMPKGGELKVRVTNEVINEQDARELSPGPYVTLTVEDTGIGIEPEAAKRVFEPFFSTKPAHQNSGLGLSMAHGFIIQSGGSIHVESELGKGTRLTLSFPAISKQDPKATLASNKGSEHSYQIRILLAEDQPAVLNILQRILEAEGHKVTPAPNGDEAASLFEIGAFDLLITDIDMPGKLQGTDLAIHVRIADPELPVIFLSGHPQIQSLKQNEGTGIWLQKPIARADLLAAVTTAVR